ncbi:MAG: outer membrane chaperone Skp [Planctomyces sp.]|nr:outer membrane chaperone Skp [Planctomyces sp.]
MGTVLSTCSVATAQNATQAAKPHKIGLIDMAYIFKNYDKFIAERKLIEEELQVKSEEAKGQGEKIARLQEALKAMNPTSPEFSAAEKEYAAAVAGFKADASRIKRELVMKEADLYKRTYLEVTTIIGKYAQAYNYTLILRYSNETVEAEDGPQEVMQKMSSLVVYHEQGNDITANVLDYMNNKYKEAAGGAGGATAPSSGTRR